MSVPSCTWNNGKNTSTNLSIHRKCVVESQTISQSSSRELTTIPKLSMAAVSVPLWASMLCWMWGSSRVHGPSPWHSKWNTQDCDLKAAKLTSTSYGWGVWAETPGTRPPCCKRFAITTVNAQSTLSQRYSQRSPNFIKKHSSLCSLWYFWLRTIK